MPLTRTGSHDSGFIVYGIANSSTHQAAERRDDSARQPQRRVQLSTRTKIAGYKREVWSVQAQSPRQSECCAELGRKPSDGEPANPRTKIIEDPSRGMQAR